MNDFNDSGTSPDAGALRLGLNVDSVLSLTSEERRLHVYIAGKTGVGKSTLMLTMMVQDLEAGRGFALLDPHGDLAERLLDYVPRRLTGRVVYLNPNEPDWAVGLNILEQVPEPHRPVVAAGILSAMRHIWSDSWGPRLAHFLLNTILALMDTPAGGMRESQARSVVSYLQRLRAGGVVPSRVDYKPGIVVYGTWCVRCHIIDGEGVKTGPDLTEAGETRDAKWLQAWIADPGTIDAKADMPAFGDRLTPDELTAVATFLAARKRR